MKLNGTYIEFKYNITHTYDSIEEVPYWKVYFVHRKRYTFTNAFTGITSKHYNQVTDRVIERPVTYNDVIEGLKDVTPLPKGVYVVCYPRKTNKFRSKKTKN